MKILMFCHNDPAGMSIAFTDAINKHTKHSCRTITTKEIYSCGFKKDIHIPDLLNCEKSKIIENTIQFLLKESDIFHFHTLFTEDEQIGPYKISDYSKNKTIVRHFHGHPFVRGNPDKYRIECRKKKHKVLVSTPDLKLFFPESTWLPNIVDIYDPLYLPSNEKHEEFTVSQAITNYALKDTETLIAAAKKANVKLDLIMNVSHRDCLKRKQKSHLCFDHLRGFYGLSSLESFSQGVPVIANLSDWVSVNIKEFAETENLPWIKCRSSTEVEDVFWNKRDHLPNLGILSRKFMETHWSDKKVVNRLIKFYEGL